jgi:hypothetical protein
MWTIKCYVDANGQNEIQQIYKSGSADLRATLESALEYLKEQPKQDWRRPSAQKLVKNKKFRDFYEIRFKADNVQQRPIGYFGPGVSDFTVLIWAHEKGNALKPATWHKTAVRRMEEIKDGTASVKEFKFNSVKA